MPDQRIKGQEVEISVLADGKLSSFVDINSFEMMANFETTEEGYLGEKSNRYDEFYKGWSADIKMHNSNGEIFTFQQIVKDRAQRRTPGVVINIKATLTFPNGTRKRVIMTDAFFENMGVAFASRDAYGETGLSAKGSEFRVL